MKACLASRSLSTKKAVRVKSWSALPHYFDTSWQKRGTGRNYNCLSGVGHVFGVQRGKVLSTSTRQKQCRTCDVAGRRGTTPAKPNCRKNWSQSAKAIEVDLCVENIRAINEGDESVKVAIIVGDDDSSAVYQVRSQVEDTITKWSDVNHAKMTPGSKLYDLKNVHKERS